MTGKTPPAGTKLARSINKKKYYSDEYENWTAETLIDFLSEAAPDAPVFITSANGKRVKPIEWLTGNSGGVELG